MNATPTREDALTNWSQALASAPHVVTRAAIDEPRSIQRLADSAASLHGLVHYIIENYAVGDDELAELEWDVDLLEGASSFLYRNLGLSVYDTKARLDRMSGAMMGTARYMQPDPLEAWQSVRRAVAKAPPIEDRVS
jgi:hypothetical protein